MKHNQTLVIAIVLLVLVGAGGYVLIKDSSKKITGPTPYVDSNATPVDMNEHSSAGGYIGQIKNLSSTTLTLGGVVRVRCSNCPGGYKLENDSGDTSVIVFDLASNPQVKLQTYSHTADGNFMFDQQVSFKTFLQIFNNPPTSYPVKSLLYSILLKDNKVIEITEYYQA